MNLYFGFEFKISDFKELSKEGWVKFVTEKYDETREELKVSTEEAENTTDLFTSTKSNIRRSLSRYICYMLRESFPELKNDNYHIITNYPNYTIKIAYNYGEVSKFKNKTLSNDIPFKVSIFKQYNFENDYIFLSTNIFKHSIIQTIISELGLNSKPGIGIENNSNVSFVEYENHDDTDDIVPSASELFIKYNKTRMTLSGYLLSKRFLDDDSYMLGTINAAEFLDEKIEKLHNKRDKIEQELFDKFKIPKYADLKS